VGCIMVVRQSFEGNGAGFWHRTFVLNGIDGWGMSLVVEGCRAVCNHVPRVVSYVESIIARVA
jgi:hypothetical protein